jgi:glutathione S-transferase kappa 1
MNQATGNKPPGPLPAKAVYGRIDLPRMKNYFEVPIMENSPSKFPVMSLKAQRLLCAIKAADPSKLKDAARGIWDQFWSKDRNMEEDPVLIDALKTAGFNEKQIKDLFVAINTPAVKEQLNKNTALALEKLGYGAPWIWVQKTDENGKVHDSYFFGNDRWELIALWLEENWYGPVPGKRPIFKDRKVVGHIEVARL